MTSIGPLVVVGIAGLDWEGLSQKIAAGALPGFARLIQGGSAGSLASAVPAAEIAAWGTLATGLWPEDHGLLLADAPWAGGLRPVGKAGWRANPAWQRLSDAGVSTASVNWPATSPGAAWSGVHVDDRFPLSDGWLWDDWPLPLGVARDDWREELRDLRVHISDITGTMLKGLIPDYEGIDQSRDHRLLEVARQMAAFSTTHAAAREVLQKPGLQAAFVRYDFLARARDTLSQAAPPFDQVVDGAWALLDATIADIADTAGIEGRTTFVISPGYQGKQGVFIASGPTVPQGKQVVGATILDIAPTIYAHFGLGDARLTGRLLAGTQGKLRQLPVETGPVATPVPDPGDLARVEAAGFAPPPVPLAEHRIRQLLVEAQLLAPRDPHRAASLAREAETIGAATVTSLGMQAVSLFALEDADALLEIARKIAAIDPGHLWGDLALTAYYALRGDRPSAAPLLLRVEREGGPDERMRAAAAYIMLGETQAARRVFREVLVAMPDNVGALLGLASTSEVRSEIEDYLRRVVRINPGHVQAREALERLAGPIEMSRREVAD